MYVLNCHTEPLSTACSSPSCRWSKSLCGQERRGRHPRPEIRAKITRDLPNPWKFLNFLVVVQLIHRPKCTKVSCTKIWKLPNLRIWPIPDDYQEQQLQQQYWGQGGQWEDEDYSPSPPPVKKRRKVSRVAWTSWINVVTRVNFLDSHTVHSVFFIRDSLKMSLECLLNFSRICLGLSLKVSLSKTK